jgi:hypothetical protein
MKYTELKQIAEFPRYSVTEDGRVYSFNSNQYLTPAKFNSGYEYVLLYNGSRDSRKKVLVHRLVASVWCPNPDPATKNCVNHKNGIKDDNRACNLEWVTHQENDIHAFQTGLRTPQKGEKHGQSKLTEAQVKDIITELNAGMSAQQLAIDYKVSDSLISMIKSGKRWGYLKR